MDAKLSGSRSHEHLAIPVSLGSRGEREPGTPLFLLPSRTFQHLVYRRDAGGRAGIHKGNSHRRDMEIGKEINSEGSSAAVTTMSSFRAPM